LEVVADVSRKIRNQKCASGEGWHEPWAGSEFKPRSLNSRKEPRILKPYCKAIS